MSHDELKALLEDVSAEVPAPSFAGSSWRQARKKRIQGYVGSTAAVAVLVAAAVVIAPWRGDPPPTPAPPAATTLLPEVHRLPATPAQRWIAPLPKDSAGLVPQDVQQLSEHPIDAAVAVFQPTTPEGDTEPQPIYALAPDGIWVVVDVVDPVRTEDADGNQADPLRPASLSPDRKRIAIPQPSALDIVDLTTGRGRHITVPGLNEQVVWQDDKTVLVGGDGPGVVAVDWATGVLTGEAAGFNAWDGTAVPAFTGGPGSTAGPLPGSAATVAPDGTDPPESLLLELPPTGRAVWQYEPGKAEPVRETPLFSIGGYDIGEWYGSPIAGGDRIVRAAWGTTSSGGYESIAVVNTRTGIVERLLDLGAGRWKACCRPLAWVDADTVLVQTEREGVLAWNFRTGDVSVVISGPISGTLSVRMP